MGLLIRALTHRASICRGVGFQTLTLDRLTAANADTVRAERDTLQRTLDCSDLLHVAGDLRQIYVYQEVGEGSILEIADAARDIGIVFVVGPGQRLASLVPQFVPSVPQLVLEVRVLAAPGGAPGSS